MKNTPRFFAFSIALICLASFASCKKKSSLLEQEFVGVFTGQKWKLVKIESPHTLALTGSQIGYTEILEHVSQSDDDFDKVWRNDTLFHAYRLKRTHIPIVDSQNQTFTYFYDFGFTRRHFKIAGNLNDPVNATLIASAYLNDSINQPDTVTYYYTVHK